MFEDGALYGSPRGLYDFQVEDVSRAYLSFQSGATHSALVLWDTGTGKTHFAMALAALMIEDDMIDQVLVLAEQNKVLDWANDDFPTFTKLDTLAYRGTPQRRGNILDKEKPTVLVSTYETTRNDIGTFAPRAKHPTADGRMVQHLLGKRTLLVFDEFSKMGSRGSALYRAVEYLMKVLRKDKGSQLYTVGMTATSVERNPETHFNACRLLAPELSPTINEFRLVYVKSYNAFGDPSEFRNLTELDCDPGVTPLSKLYGPITYRRRKSDPELMAQFPAKVENPFRFVPLSQEHWDFYDSVQEVVLGLDEDKLMGGYSVLRQIAAHPAALIYSQGELAQAIVAEVGTEGLWAIPVTKVEEMLAWCRLNSEQQMVIFTFYGQSVLPILRQYLTQAGYRVSINHGQMSADERHASQSEFKAGRTQIFLTSDAGARGLNLECGSALLHYELPSKFSTYIQRSDRVHRIGSRHPSVTVDALVAGGGARRSTVEAALAQLMSKRNLQSDQVMGDDITNESEEGFLSGEDRKELLWMARRLSA